MKRELKLPQLRMSSSFEPSTLDAAKRTVELLWYTGAWVTRFSYWDGETYELAFSMEPKAVRLGRLTSGAPVLDSHNNYRLSGVLGVVEKAWIDGGKGRAIVRFSEREEVKPVFEDVKAGILRNVSMGAIVHQMKEVTEKGDRTKKFLAIDWEPMEVSLVAVGADPGAQALATADKFPCTVNFSAAADADAPKGGTVKIKIRLLADVENLGKLGEIVELEEKDFDEKLHSKELEVPKSTSLAADEKSRKRVVDDAIEADKSYSAEVKRLAVHFGMEPIDAQREISKTTPIEQVVETFSDLRRQRGPKPSDNKIGFGDEHESAPWRRKQMALAIAARAAGAAPPDSARQYAYSSFAECALECLSFRGEGRGLDARRNGNEIIELALHSTSDFPLLLADALNKNLLPAYEQAPQTYRRIAAKKNFKDFKPTKFLRAGDFPVPLLVGENGEYKYGTMSENKEVVTLATYGVILGLSRQVLVNDDTGALQDLATAAGRRSADFENATFYAACILVASGLGPTLLEGAVAVYNAAHANITATGVLSNTTLASGLALMMSQTSKDGLKLNTEPKILLVSPTSLVLARTLLTAIQATQASNVNTFAGQMVAIGDANLGTQVRFYMLADPAQLPQYVYGFLEGQNGPRTMAREGFNVDGVEFKLSLDFACGAVDFRGGCTGAGQ